MSDTKLMPCPFCGSDDVHFRIHRNEKYEEVGAQIECYGCLTIFVQAEAINRDELAKAWNRRVKDDVS